MPTDDPSEDWAQSAACRGHPPDLFVPSVDHVEGQTRAKRICATCPVREDCLQEGLVGRVGSEPLKGIWGGTTEQERSRIRAMLGGRRLREALGG